MPPGRQPPKALQENPIQTRDRARLVRPLGRTRTIPGQTQALDSGPSYTRTQTGISQPRERARPEWPIRGRW